MDIQPFSLLTSVFCEPLLMSEMCECSLCFSSHSLRMAIISASTDSSWLWGFSFYK